MKFKKVFLFSLALLLLLLVSPAKAEAATVAKIGSKSYSSIAKAIDAVKSGQTIKVVKNTKWGLGTLHSQEMQNKKVTIDLGGHTVTLKATESTSGFFDLRKSALTIKNGTLKDGGKNTFRIRAEKKSKLNLSNLRITIADTSFEVKGKGSGITVKKVKMTRKAGPVAVFGVAAGAKAAFYSGTFTTQAALIGNSGGTVTIKGGSYSYPNSTFSTSMISNCPTTDLDGKKWAGSMTISGGTFKSNDYILVDNYIGGNLKLSGKAVLEGCSPVRSQGKLTMTGGKVHAIPYETSHLCRPAIDSSSAPKGCSVILSGGKLISDGNAAVIISKDTKYKNTGTVLNPGEGCKKVIRQT